MLGPSSTQPSRSFYEECAWLWLRACHSQVGFSSESFSEPSSRIHRGAHLAPQRMLGDEACILCGCYETLQEVGHSQRGRDARVRDSSWSRLWRQDFQGDRVAGWEKSISDGRRVAKALSWAWVW